MFVKRSGNVRNGFAFDIYWPNKEIYPNVPVLKVTNVNLSDKSAIMKIESKFTSSDSEYFSPIPISYLKTLNQKDQLTIDIKGY